MDYYKEDSRQQKTMYPYINDMKYKMRPGTRIPNRIFVGGLCPQATETDLRNLFGKYGSIREVKLLTNPDGTSRCYGFVTYEKADDVKRLENDVPNTELMLNGCKVNIAPAIMKYTPGHSNRQEPLLPVTPSLYFNNLAFPYQDATPVCPSNHPYAIVPQMSETTFYPSNNYAVPATPYQGTALFYPLPPNTSQVVVGHQPLAPPVTNPSSFPQPTPIQTSASSSYTTKPNPSLTAISSNSSADSHVSHNSQAVIATAPPPVISNLSSVPPPMPYQIPHPTHYINSAVMPHYPGEFFYNMVPGGACFPMFINGHEAAYIPYYDPMHDPCGNNFHVEGVHGEPMNNYQSNGHLVDAPELNNLNGRGSSPNSNHSSTDCKPMPPPPPGPPPTVVEPIRDNSYTPENSTSTNSSSTPPTNVIHVNEYSPPTPFVQHRGAILYPSPAAPMPQQNVYLNSVVYAPDSVSQSVTHPYSKTLTDHFVIDHLPKRDQKYSTKKYGPPTMKDTLAPNIPEFPFYVNNNYPGYVNRNLKEKEHKSVNIKMGDNSKFSPRVGSAIPPRTAPIAQNGVRVYHNQNHVGGGPPRPPKNERGNMHMPAINGQYIRTNSRIPRSAYDHAAAAAAVATCYQYSSNSIPIYNKTGYEGYRKSGQPNNNYHKNKYDKLNGNYNNNNENMYSNKNVSEDLQQKKAVANRQNDVEEQEQSSVSTQSENEVSAEVIATSDDDQLGTSQQMQEQQVCANMQKLAV